MKKIGKFFNRLFLIYQIFFLNYIWKKIVNYNQKVIEIKKEKQRYKKLFIKDEEDEQLNKEYLSSFDKKIEKINKKLSKLKIKLNKKIYKLGFFKEDFYEDFILKCYNHNISADRIGFVKDIILYFK